MPFFSICFYYTDIEGTSDQLSLSHYHGLFTLLNINLLQEIVVHWNCLTIDFSYSRNGVCWTIKHNIKMRNFFYESTLFSGGRLKVGELDPRLNSVIYL